MADITIAPVLDATLASTAHIIYTDAATGTTKKAPISALPLSDAEVTALAGKASTSHNHDASAITAGTLDGDRLPALSTTKKGGVPATGVGPVSTKFLSQLGTWLTPAGVGGSTLPIKSFENDFGGRGDDSTDNTAALEEVAAAFAIEKFDLKVGLGLFRTGTFDIPPQMNIIGSGMDMWNNSGSYPRGTVFKSIAAEPIFRYLVSDYVTLHSGRIEYIQFDGDGIGTNGWDFEGFHQFYYHRCGFRGFTDSAVKMRGSLVGTFHELLMLECANGIDLDSKVFSADGPLPPNFIRITNCKGQEIDGWAIQHMGGSTLYVQGGDFEKCGTIGVDSGVVKEMSSGEGIGLVMRDTYCEQTHGFATVHLGSANSDVIRHTIENCQFNASSSPAVHDIYVDATGLNKQRVYIANSLVRNAGGLTVVGNNATLTIINSTIPERDIPAGVKVIEITDEGEILANGLPVGGNGGELPVYSDGDLTSLGLDTSNHIMYFNSTASEPQVWDGTGYFSLDKTPYTPTAASGVEDNFNRADNASSLGNTQVPGTAWPAPSSGTWGIASNQMYCASQTNSGAAAVYRQLYNLGVADFDMTIDMTMVDSASVGGVNFRYIDANNFFQLAVFSGSIELVKRVAGVETNLGTVSGGVAATPATYRIICSGTSVIVLVNTVSAFNITESDLSTGTSIGFFVVSGAGSGGGMRWDNLDVTA